MKAYTRFNTLTWVPTDHFMNERMERYLGIVEKGIGFGSYFVVVLDRDDGCYECLTNTGILVVLTQKLAIFQKRHRGCFCRCFKC